MEASCYMALVGNFHHCGTSHFVILKDKILDIKFYSEQVCSNFTSSYHTSQQHKLGLYTRNPQDFRFKENFLINQQTQFLENTS